MIRGTTAQFRFHIPYKFDEINWVTIKFWQKGNTGTTESPLPITKRKTDCYTSSNPNEICVSLNPDETSRFSDQLKAYVQLRAQTEDGITFASNQELITVYPINNEMIAEDPDLPVPEPGDSVVLLDGSTI